MTPIEEIEKDLDWRESELGILKLLLADDQTGEREKAVLFRAAWALLYAHYEGFCKFALTVYYDTIEGLGKCNRELPIKMQSVALEKHVKSLRKLSTIDLITNIGVFDQEVMGLPAKFPDVDTDSNLWPSTLRSLLENADLTVPALNQFNRSLGTLVSRRNKIAHGERDIIPEYSYYTGFEEAVRSVLYDLTVAIDRRLREIV